MSDTTTPAELHIPDAAADHHFTCGCSDSGCSRAGYQSDAIPIIVAAELRRMAEEICPHLDDTPSRAFYGEDLSESAGAARALRARADELDPQP